MRYLSILLFAPWLLVSCWSYWAYPGGLPSSARQHSFDALVLLLAGIATAIAALSGFDTAAVAQVGELRRPSGGIWQPALYGYGAFTAVLVPALWLRQRCWGRYESARGNA